MDKKRLGLRITAILCAALGWWGLLYPQLTLTPDTVKSSARQEDGSLTPLPEEWDFEGSLYLDLLQAKPEQITFRSKLLTDISTFWEVLHDNGKNRTDPK